MKMEHNRPEIKMPAIMGGAGEPLTMSSREIAELVEARHDNVKVTIERLVKRGVIAQPATQDMKETGGNNRVYTTQEYRLDKRSSLIVVAQLCPEFTARLVDRWQQLEEEKAGGGFALLTGAQLMAAALIEADATMRAQAVQIEAMKVDVAAHERLAKADGSLCFRDSAKSLQVRPVDLTQFLATHRWTYRQAQNGPWLAYQDKITAGYLEHKVTTVDRSDGTEKAVTQCRITPKGLSKLAKLIGGAA